MSGLLKLFKKQKTVVRPINDVCITGESENSQRGEKKFLVDRQSKYISVWRRIKIKIISQIRIKRILSNAKLLGVDNRNKRDSINTVDIEGFFKRKLEETKDSTIERVSRRFAINPDSLFRNIWDVYLTIWLVYCCIITPVELAFFTVLPGDPLFIIDLIIDLSFFLDVILNCFTGFYDNEGALHMGNKEIIKKYLSTWFILDLTAGFPSGILDLSMGDNQSFSNYDNLLKIVKIRSIGRLLKVTRAVKFFKISQKDTFFTMIQSYLQLSFTVRRALTTILSILISIHIFGCVFYFSCVVNEFSPDTWVVRYGYQDSPILDIYITCIYYAFVTLATIGYGEITPQTSFEKILSIIWIVISTYFLSFVISSLSSSLSLYDIKRALMDQKFSLLDRFAEEVRLDKFTKKKIQDEIRMGVMRSTYSSNLKGEVIQELSGSLKFLIAKKMYGGVLHALKFFSNKDQIFVSTIFPLLESYNYIENEVIYAENDYADYVYFLGKGIVNFIFGENNSVFRVISPGEHFGDIEIVKQTRRMFSVICPKKCFLLGMNLSLLNKIKKDYSVIWEELKKQAENKQKQMIRSLAEMKVLLNINALCQIGKIKTKDLKFSILEEINSININFTGNNKRSDISDLLNIVKHESVFTKEKLKRIEERLSKWRNYQKANEKKLKFLKRG